jgi:hypothetical protein
MGVLMSHFPNKEILDGELLKRNKTDNQFTYIGNFKYRNPSQEEVDTIIEMEGLKGALMVKRANVIYTSSTETFTSGDKLNLEDQKTSRKIVKIVPDRTKSRRSDYRLRGRKYEQQNLGRLITLE